MNLPWKQVSATEIANLVAARLTSGPARLAMLIIFLLESPVLSQEFTFTTIVGNAGLPGAIDGMNSETSFNSPYGITVDNSQNLYVSDIYNNTIRKITREGTNWLVSTIAGTRGNGGTNDGSGLEARLLFPNGMAWSPEGYLLVTDSMNHSIRRLDFAGTECNVTTIAGAAEPTGSGTRDGTNNVARFGRPTAITFDLATNIYVSDNMFSLIRQITRSDTNYTVKTIAGAFGGGARDGTNKTAAFLQPRGIVADKDGSLYVADQRNHAIRKITPIGTNWVVTTIAGLLGTSGSLDGTNSESRFNQPEGLCMDERGDLYVADYGNHTIRKMVRAGTNWVVRTIGGRAGTSGATDGTGETATFFSPRSVCVDRFGSLYVADTGNFTVRLGQTNPQLEVTRGPNGLVLSWPSDRTDLRLETAQTISPDASWSPVEGTTNTTYVIEIEKNSAAFFRLVKRQ